jgi:hypothetical protein
MVPPFVQVNWPEIVSAPAPVRVPAESAKSPRIDEALAIDSVPEEIINDAALERL